MRCVACGKGGARFPVACLTDGDFAAKVVFDKRAVCASHEKKMSERILDSHWPSLAKHFYGLPRPVDAGRTYPKKDFTRFAFIDEGVNPEEIPHMVRK